MCTWIDLLPVPPEAVPRVAGRVPHDEDVSSQGARALPLRSLVPHEPRDVPARNACMLRRQVLRRAPLVPSVAPGQMLGRQLCIQKVALPNCCAAVDRVYGERGVLRVDLVVLDDLPRLGSWFV